MENMIIKIAKQILGDEVNINTSINNNADWSSIKTIQLIMALDEEGINIPIEKMSMIQSIKDIIKIVNGDQ